MQKDFTQVLAADRVKIGQTCKTSIALANLDAKVRAGVITALADPLIPGAKIARGLRRLGQQVSDANVCRHRNHECKCA